MESKWKWDIFSLDMLYTAMLFTGQSIFKYSFLYSFGFIISFKTVYKVVHGDPKTLKPGFIKHL